MSLPPSGALGGSGITTSEFQARIEALRDEVATLISAMNAAELEILSNDSDILDLQNNKADLTGTYPNLRAQGTTKADVGLSSVNNYGASSSVTSSSSTTYATSLAAKTAFDEANKALSRVTLFTGSTFGDISLSQAYTNFRWLVIVAGETDWGSAIVIETDAIAKAWERSSSKYVHAVGSDGFIEILQSGTTSTYLNMGGSLRGLVTAVYGVGDF